MGSDIPKLVEPDEGSRTVLVYMAAHNSLKGFVQEDLDEMKQGILSVTNEGAHLLVYKDVGTSPCQLVELKNDGTEEVLAEYESPRNSVGVTEMQEVFRDAFSARPADSYGLVYWSHGDGWVPDMTTTRWIGQDYDAGVMSIADLVSVLQAAPHFDFIMFDACFMQSVEVAYELRYYTDYYIGSPTENPGPGAPYDKIMQPMFVKGAARQIASAYFNAYNDLYAEGNGISNTNWTGGLSIGVLDTSRLEELARATGQALAASVPTADKATLRGTVFDYDNRSSSHIGYYDMQELMEALVQDPALYAEWKLAFDAAMGYWNTTAQNYSQFVGMFSMERANGLTHYIPSDSKPATAVAYRQMGWYQAAGLNVLGW